ncbi:MAG: EamA family transporter [Candidatus Sericytochromatia bacterium]
MEAQATVSTATWLVPALATLVLYGIGQGFVKMFIEDAPPAKFCLFFVVAKTILNLSYFFTHDHPDPFSPDARTFMMVGILAYILDGAGWILYFQSIVHGPITIVGTLSAAYPALTILLAKFFLSESLMTAQYLGVFIVIACCLGLSYTPKNPDIPQEDLKVTNSKWIPFAFFALLLWSSAQTIMKYAYSLPNSNDANMLVFNTIGGALTLGVYGVLFGIKGQKNSLKELGKSFLPMGMMAAGDIGVIISSSTGPISIISPLTGAYPLVTLIFAALVLKEKIIKFHWLCIAVLLFGIFLSSADKDMLTNYLPFLSSLAN